MRSTRGASLLDFPLLVPKNSPSLELLQYFEGMGERNSRSGGIWEASTALCLHVPAALTLDTRRLGWIRRKKDTHTHCRLLNVSILSKYFRAMFGPYLPFVYYRVSSLLHLTGDSVFFLGNGFCLTVFALWTVVVIQSSTGLPMICMQGIEICMEIKLPRTEAIEYFPLIVTRKCSICSV